MPLKIELKPGEKFIVNGAVMVAGRAGASLALKNKAMLLRGRDVMQEHDATTPARRIYFNLMLMYIDPDRRDAHSTVFRRFVEEYLSTTTLTVTIDRLHRIRELAAAGDFYSAMKTCKEVIGIEDGLLSPPATPATPAQAVSNLGAGR
jgi:flagellar protein FlbT